MSDSITGEYDKIKKAMGECISAWSSVERSVTLLFCACMIKRETEFENDVWLHAYVFESVISFDARLSMIHAALRWRCRPLNDSVSGPFLDSWVKLQKRLEKKYRKRHAVAHSDFKQTNNNGKITVTLLPFAGVMRPFDDEPGLSVQDLEQRRDMFDFLAGDVGKFKAEVLEFLRQSQ